MKTIYDENLKDFVVSSGTPHWVVQSVEPKKDYTLFLTFANGEKRVYNAAPLLEKAIFSPLKNLAFFMGAEADGVSVAWSDDIDIAPEHLYEHSIPIGGVINV